MSDRYKDAVERYTAAAQAMQSGVAAGIGLPNSATSPKHLRVGINSAMVDSSALAGLMMKKGMITKTEYAEALADAMEEEKKRYEDMLSSLTGKKVTLA